jgi:hypothetical protein
MLSALKHPSRLADTTEESEAGPLRAETIQDLSPDEYQNEGSEANQIDNSMRLSESLRRQIVCAHILIDAVET